MPAKFALDQLQIAVPCSADWDAMAGDGRVRHCGDCRMNVYNISAMTEAQACELIATHEGRACIRMYQRTDGTIITRDCPVGLAAQATKASKKMLAVVALILFMVFGGFAVAASSSGRTHVLDNVMVWLGLKDGLSSGVVMGERCPAPAPAPAPAPSGVEQKP